MFRKVIMYVMFKQCKLFPTSGRDDWFILAFVSGYGDVSRKEEHTRIIILTGMLSITS